MPLHLGRLLFKFTLPLDILDAKDSHSQHYGQEGKRKSPLCAGVSDFFALICGGERGIRTLGGVLSPHSLSRRAPSADSVISPAKLI
jgi:hypothetical protein